MKKNKKAQGNIKEDLRPATKRDVDELAQMTSQQFDRVDGAIAGLRADVSEIKIDVSGLKNDVRDLSNVVDRIDRTQNTILEILDDNTKILKEIRTLPALASPRS